MGGAVSSGCNNDDLIDKLLEADYIKTSLIERVFRAVDRADYFLAEARGNAYKDLAWKSGNLHLSAPCIYSEVMEGLELSRGQSFLNLGSGTGYLSTMVGLILGSSGINHGIEIFEDVIEYSVKKLEDFKRYSGAIDEYDFCEPKFVQGNCLCLSSECTVLYDRIYCGAACPEQYESYMKSLLKIGGILVVPIKDQLFQIKRTSESDYTSKSLLPVSFATLIVPLEGSQEWLNPIEFEPPPLQVLCRAAVRNILRKNIEFEFPPPVKKAAPAKAPTKKRALRRLVVPLFDDEDSSEEERHVRLGGERNRDAGRATFRRDDDTIFRFFLGMGNRRGSSSDGERHSPNKKSKDAKAKQETMEVDDSNTTEDNLSERTAESSTSRQVRAVIEHHPEPQESNNNDNNENQEVEEALETINEISDVIVECLHQLRRERGDEEEDREGENDENQETEEDRENAGGIDAEPNATQNPSTSRREKFDSGLGDEIIEAQDSSEDEDRMKLDAISSCDEETSNVDRLKFRRLYKRGQDTSTDTEEEMKQIDLNEMRMYKSPFTLRMRVKIDLLPLPPILKKYLNFYREF